MLLIIFAILLVRIFIYLGSEYISLDHNLKTQEFCYYIHPQQTIEQTLSGISRPGEYERNLRGNLGYAIQSAIRFIIVRELMFDEVFLIKESCDNRYLGLWSTYFNTDTFLSLNLFHKNGRFSGSYCFYSLSRFNCPLVKLEEFNSEGTWDMNYVNLSSSLCQKKNNKLLFELSDNRNLDNQEPAMLILEYLEDTDQLSWVIQELNTGILVPQSAVLERE